jgi:hypothetical protein
MHLTERALGGDHLLGTDHLRRTGESSFAVDSEGDRRHQRDRDAVFRVLPAGALPGLYELGRGTWRGLSGPGSSSRPRSDRLWLRKHLARASAGTSGPEAQVRGRPTPPSTGLIPAALTRVPGRPEEGSPVAPATEVPALAQGATAGHAPRTLGRRWRPRTGHLGLGALVQQPAPAHQHRLCRASRVRKRVLRSEPTRAAAAVGTTSRALTGVPLCLSTGGVGARRLSSGGPGK